MSEFAELRDKTVLVTGGAGFIGSNLVPLLLDIGCTVRVADNLSRGSINNIRHVLSRIDFRNEDLTRLSSCREVTMGVDVVFHLASPVGGIQFIRKENVANLTPALLMHTNLIEAARENDVKHFLFASSACVYTEKKTDLNEFKETDAYPANPPTTYGWAKIAGEKLCKAYTDDYGMRTAVTRIFNAYGENENLDPSWSHVVPSLIRKAILHPKEEFAIFGDGSQERAFLYVRDCVEGLVRVIEKISDGQAVNLGSQELSTIKDLAKQVVEISGKAIPLKFDPNGPKGVNRYCANLETLSRKIGWIPRTPLREGLQRTYRWAAQTLQGQGDILQLVANESS